LLFIVDPLDELKAYKDSSIAMMRAAQDRPVTRSGPSSSPSIHWTNAARRLRDSCAAGDRARRRMPEWYVEASSHDRALRDFAAVIMRKDPPFDIEYVTTTWLLERAEAEGARVFNRPRALARSFRKARDDRISAVRRRRPGHA
jgi:glutathione synthase